jgi:hypothetical protein
MAVKNAEVAQDRASRGKRLVKYGMFVIVLMAFVITFAISWIVLAPLGKIGPVILYSVLAAIGAAILCVIAWFGYVKLVLKE